MPLNKASGNMYDFIEFTYNPITGVCPHECSYCYVERIRNRFKIKAKPPRLIVSPHDLGQKNRQKIKHIFVGSSTDIFAHDIPGEWIRTILSVLTEGPFHSYLFQTKNPARYLEFVDGFPLGCILAATIESSREYPKIYNLAPSIVKRVEAFSNPRIYQMKMITIEPILDFDIQEFTAMIKSCNPYQVNIGADSGHNHLPEPSPEKTAALIGALRSHNIKVHLKKNLGRLYKEIMR